MATASVFSLNIAAEVGMWMPADDSMATLATFVLVAFEGKREDLQQVSVSGIEAQHPCLKQCLEVTVMVGSRKAGHRPIHHSKTRSLFDFIMGRLEPHGVVTTWRGPHCHVDHGHKLWFEG